jgi:hypothetical protein
MLTACWRTVVIAAVSARNQGLPSSAAVLQGCHAVSGLAGIIGSFKEFSL